MNFRTWLITNYVDKDEPIGDLARDVRDDDEWPTEGPNTLAAYRDHLEAMGAISGALDALEDAWSAYEAQRS